MLSRFRQTIIPKVSTTTRSATALLSMQSDAQVTTGSWSRRDERRHMHANARSGEATTLAQQQEFTSVVSDPLWSNSYSFASPEADFTAQSITHHHQEEEERKEEAEWSNQLSFASPESDFVAASLDQQQQEKEEEFQENDLMQNYSQLQHILDQSFPSLEAASCPESASGSRHVMELLDSSILLSLYQRHQDEQQLEEQLQLPLPRTFQEAMDPRERRAVVVTKPIPPFEIVAVNDAWIDLCGYSRNDIGAQPTTLGILQGPETNRHVLDDMVQNLVPRGQQDQVQATVVNYTKTGRKFHNQLRAGALRNETSGELTHLVGILQEIRPEQQQQQVMAA